MRPSHLAAPLALAALLAPAAAQADTVLDPVPGRDVDQLGGFAAWSRPAGDGFELVLRREDGTTSVVAGPQQADPQQDLGTDADGDVVLVFLRCLEDDGCAIVQLDAATGAIRRIAGGRDRTPALWNGVYAFSRSYPPEGQEVVYLRRLGSGRPSRRIWTTGRVPRRTTSDVTSLDYGQGGVAFGHDLLGGDLRTTQMWAKRPGRSTALVARARSGALSVARHGGPSVVGQTLLWTYHRALDVPRGLLLRRALPTGRTEEATVPGLATSAAGDALRPAAPVLLGTTGGDEGGTDAVWLLDPAPTFRPARRGIGIRG